MAAVEAELLASLGEICASVLEPNAQEVDRGSDPPLENLRLLAQAGLVAVTTPAEWGGSACSGAFMREYTELMTAACGTTWFVLTQHLGACASVAGSANPRLRELYLKQMARGEHWVGVGFGHLRRPEPLLRAQPVDGGYLLTGVAPWVTGWPILSGVIFGAVLPDQRYVYLYADAAEGPALRSSPPLPICAMNASATTEVHLDGLFVPEENWVRFSTREDMARGDLNGIAGAVAPPLGCARGSHKILETAASKRGGLAARQAAMSLAAEIDACRVEAYLWADGPKDRPDYKENALRARAAAITLGVRAAHSAVAASGGGANARTHPAQRLFREAMFYTLTAQTEDTMAATLQALEAPIHPSPSPNRS